MIIFDEFKKYLSSKDYEIDEISETSIRGIKKDLKVHLFWDWKYDEYVINVNNKGYKL